MKTNVVCVRTREDGTAGRSGRYSLVYGVGNYTVSKCSPTTETSTEFEPLTKLRGSLMGTELLKRSVFRRSTSMAVLTT